MLPDDELVLSALLAAWRTTAVAVALFLAALALAPYWDTAIFLHSLRQSLASDW